MSLDVLQLYKVSEVQRAEKRYGPNLRGLWEEDFLSRLTRDERALADAICLKHPLVGVTHHPLEFYSNPSTEQVFLPIASIKFVDDLTLAFAYYDAMGLELGTVSDYVAALRFQPEKAKGSPLDALGVPRDAFNNSQVDDVAQKLLKSILYFVAAHEYAHVMYRHGGYETMTAQSAQVHEEQADEFALGIMARIGVPPIGLTFFFLLASRLEASPGDFPSLIEYEKYLRQRATHPLGSVRILKVAEYIESHNQVFARLQSNVLSWENRLLRAAQELREIASTLDDRRMRQFLAERAKNADFAAFRRGERK